MDIRISSRSCTSKIKNLLHLNPGAAGIHGFHQIRTMLRFEIHDGKLQNMEVIELGKREKVSVIDLKSEQGPHLS